MAIAYTGRETTFIAGERAPSAVGALFGEPVVDMSGRLALACIKENVLTPLKSQVELEDTDITEVLHLERALTVIISGHTDTQTGEFVPEAGDLGVRRVISGDYSGPGSELTIL